MTEENEKSSHLCHLPPELLLYIFSLLSAKDLTKCRQVCTRMRQIIDTLGRSDTFWRQHCARDFADVFTIARYKSRPGLLWFNIYRSLSLWPKLNSARESRDEFASASNINIQIRDLCVLSNGVIGVHKRNSIVYYDLETLDESSRTPISGDYLRYVENDEALVILSFNLHLFIVRKYVYRENFESDATFDGVKLFILEGAQLYFVNMDDEIYLCSLKDAGLNGRLLVRSPDSIMCLGYSGRLNILTFERHIYSLQGNKLQLELSLDAYPNLLHILQRYNFLDNLDWRVYFQWMYALNRSIPQGPLRDIVIVRTYGDIVFVGSNWGVLRVYYSPRNADGEFDIFTAEPLKQFNFMERSDCPVLSTCPILQVDVSEDEDGHTVVVAMPKKVAVLSFQHNFKRSAAAAMLPYGEIQKLKVLKMDCVETN